MIDMPPDRCHPNLSRGYAYVEYETSEDAQKALKHMDGGIFVEFCPLPNRGIIYLSTMFYFNEY